MFAAGQKEKEVCAIESLSVIKLIPPTNINRAINMLILLKYKLVQV